MATQDQTVTARVPREIRSQADIVLKQIDSSVTELINSAFTYVIKTGSLLDANSASCARYGKDGTRRFTAEERKRFEAFLEATSLPLAPRYAALDAKQIKAMRLAERYGA
ncbi:MAG TPA: hypothetical protein DEB24_02920 [Coriobacteriia bacterium]|nr:hypothetical protein [Coriobacteriia bacterium]